jgi:protein-arginine kinase activator protein McsA
LLKELVKRKRYLGIAYYLLEQMAKTNKSRKLDELNSTLLENIEISDFEKEVISKIKDLQ